jgi:hypothetical protein
MRNPNEATLNPRQDDGRALTVFIAIAAVIAIIVIICLITRSSAATIGTAQAMALIIDII